VARSNPIALARSVSELGIADVAAFGEEGAEQPVQHVVRAVLGSRKVDELVRLVGAGRLHVLNPAVEADVGAALWGRPRFIAIIESSIRSTSPGWRPGTSSSLW
jgi:hypothetical protein